jgi:hypothetical protein
MNAHATSSVDHASPLLAFERVLLGFNTFDWKFGIGLHSLLGDETSGTRDVFALAHGITVPRRGSVLLNGYSPHGRPELRRRIASVGPEPLPAMASVARLVGRISELHGWAAEPVIEQLDAWGRRALLEVPVGELDLAARTTVQLALALHHRSPLLLLLWDPFASGLDPFMLRAALEKSAAERPVLVFLRAPLTPPLPGSSIPFGDNQVAATRAPSRPSRASLWIACNGVEGVAHYFLQQRGVCGAEVLAGEPGLVRLRVDDPLYKDELCRNVLAFVSANALGLRGLRFEEDA